MDNARSLDLYRTVTDTKSYAFYRETGKTLLFLLKSKKFLLPLRWISLVVSIWKVHHPCESPDSKGSIEVHAKRETWDGNINVEAGIGREITIIMERRLQALLFLHSKLRTLGLFSGKNSNGRCPGMWLLASPYMHTVAYILGWDVRYYVFVFRGAYHIGVGSGCSKMC